MTPTSLFRELAYPVTETAVLLSMLAIFIVAQFADALVQVFLQSAFPIGVMLALFAAVAILPVMTRYLMEILNARLEGVAAQPLAIGMLQRFGLLWSLAPLGAVAGSVWLIVESGSRFGGAVALVLATLLFAVLPAFLAALAISGSLFASLNPASLLQIIRQTGWSYLTIPVVIVLGVFILQVAALSGAPRLLIEFGCLYLDFLGFSLTGAVVAASGIRERVGVPVPEEPDPVKLEAADLRARQAVVDHAYGLVSRGNREGGFAHIQAFIEKLEYLGTKADMFEWFFQQMLRWEDTAPALFFAQHYLTLLVEAGESVRALKVLSRCLYEDPRFRPRAEDRAKLRALAEAAGQEDLVRQLR